MLICILSVLYATGCATFNNAESDIQVTTTVNHDTKHNSALTAVTIEEFEKAGFNLGDSRDVLFENGYSLCDVPYYNGFYVNNEAPVIVANQGTPVRWLKRKGTEIFALL